MKQFPRLILAGTKSGVGKSSLATGIIKAFTDKGLRVQGFKIGPDYLDPGFHTRASGRVSRNLDIPLLGTAGVKEIFFRQGEQADLAVIEGVMGLFDGPANEGMTGSTATIGKLLQTPVVLIVDCSSMAQSVGALVKGFVNYDPDIAIRGLILNQIASPRHEEIIKKALIPLGVPIIGTLMKGSLPTMPQDPGKWDEWTNSLGEIIGNKIDLKALLALAQGASSPISKPKSLIFREQDQHTFSNLRIGYAFDEAFCFYYQDELEFLQHLGAELIPFSPLHDRKLPKGLGGLILGGGFLAKNLPALSGNLAIMAEIKTWGKKNFPIYGEGAGFEYLTQEFREKEGRTYPLVGLIPGHTREQDQLLALGYYEGSLLRTGILGEKDSRILGHQYRRTTVLGLPPAHQGLMLARGSRLEANGYAMDNLFASHLYQHWGGQRAVAKSFLAACQRQIKI